MVGNIGNIRDISAQKSRNSPGRCSLSVLNFLAREPGSRLCRPAMGHNPRYRQWTAANWRNVAPTVADLQRLEWRVVAVCMHCHNEYRVRLDRVAQAKGAAFVLWGRTAPCPRSHCLGRCYFACYPHKGGHRCEMW